VFDILLGHPNHTTVLRSVAAQERFMFGCLEFCFFVCLFVWSLFLYFVVFSALGGFVA
jgi:hypothetical protein